MSFQAPKNPNYAATIVALKDFVDLPNCDNVKGALIFGNHIIVSKECYAGQLGVFFPVECALSAEFLSNNNQYRKPEYGNVDPTEKGFFEQHGRVKAMKFRGYKSEGFWIPIHSLNYLPATSFNAGDVFDMVGDHEICRKYVPRGQGGKLSTNQVRQAKLEDSIVEGQFRLHFDTENLRRNAHKISPNDWISVSDKWHGTSVVIGKVLVKRSLRWHERWLRKFGVQITDNLYGLTYSSRRVIKAVNGTVKNSQHFYTEDIWGVVAKEVEDKIPNGFTLYGEIVGFTPDGSPIQGGYHYGCRPNQHRFLVYRVTLTTPDGLVVELSWQQMIEFCVKYGLENVPEFYVGRAKDLFPQLDETSHWNEAFLTQLEQTYVRDLTCPHNWNEVPAEGVVVRIDRLNECESFKLKNFRFLEAESKALDKGEVDTETAQSEEVA
jgi:hypothetical protein